MNSNVGVIQQWWVKVRKMTHGESGSLICHGLHKGQGLRGGRANVINPTLLETPNGRTLVSGHEPSIASGIQQAWSQKYQHI